MDTLLFSFLMDIFIQFVGFVFAFAFQTEKFFDLFGELSLITHRTEL